jgi:hypothetical protein
MKSINRRLEALEKSIAISGVNKFEDVIYFARMDRAGVVGPYISIKDGTPEPPPSAKIRGKLIVVPQGVYLASKSAC